MKKPFFREIGPYPTVTSIGIILAYIIVVLCNRGSYPVRCVPGIA